MLFSLHSDATLRRVIVGVFALGLLLTVSGCQGALDGLEAKEKAPVPAKLVYAMKAKGMPVDSPIMIRIFKEENVLEVWKQKDTGRYALLTDYEICKWSGKLGPKFKEGDRQAPEGFYTVNPYQMNPKSQYHLSFNIGFPNAYDRAHGRTGLHLMVHGACSSAGCYSMTDERVQEIYSLARDAFKGGQKAFQIQAYPFRMTAENMVKHRDSEHFEFWKMLKKGYDHFEITRIPPKVDVCEKRYEFNTDSPSRYPSSGQCPKREMPLSLAGAFVKQQTSFNAEFEKLLAKAEGRKQTTPEPLTFASAFPGVTIVGAQPVTASVVKAEPAKPAEPTETEPKTGAPAQKPPSASADLESVLKPAG